MNKIVKDDQEDNALELLAWERYFLLFLLALFCTAGVFDHSLWSPNESREGSMIAEMYRTDNWLMPVINGEPYLEKPPLLYWTGVLFCAMAGHVSEGLVRLPAAVYGFGAIFIAYLFARRLGYERAGIAGAFMCATSIMYMEYSRVVLTDVCIAFTVILSLWLFWCAYTEKKWFYWVLFLFASAFSFYAKGLLGPGFVWVTVMCFLLYRKEFALACILPALFIPIFMMTVTPWAWGLYQKGGVDYLNAAFIDNQLGRFFTFSNKSLPPDPYFCHKEPFYYYFKVLPVYLLPWSLPIAAGLIHWFRKGRGLSDPLSVFLRFAVVCMAIILFASSAKDTRYAIPLFPLLCLMTGIWVQQAAKNSFSILEKWALGITGLLTALLLFLIPVLVIILFFAPQAFFDHFFNGADILRAPGLFYARLAAAVCVLILLLEVAAAVNIRTLLKSRERIRSILLYPALYTAFLIPLECVVMPAYDYQRTLAPCTDIVTSEIQKNSRIALAFDDGSYIGVFTFYLNRRFPVLTSPKEAADFLSDPDTPSTVIVKTEDIEKIEECIHTGQVRVVKSDYNGLNGDSFRLLTNFPNQGDKVRSRE